MKEIPLAELFYNLLFVFIIKTLRYRFLNTLWEKIS
jgi:hypothetical protein